MTNTLPVADPATELHFSGSEAEIRQYREDKDFILKAQQWLPAAPEEVWAFLADCRHMNHVLPGFIKFQILSPLPGDHPPDLAPQGRYEYRLTLHGLGVFWRTRIVEVDRPHRFVDVQEKGPYARFSHTHRFEPLDGGTLTHDLIRYRPPGGPLAGLVDRLYVGPSLRRLFVCRHRRLAELFAADVPPAQLLKPVAEPA